MGSRPHAKESWKRAATVLVAALAFAVAWLSPGFARASIECARGSACGHTAILPACELRDQMSLMPVDPPSPEPASFADGRNEGCDQIEAAGLAPMCDARGLSIVAPPRILPVDGGSIRSIPTCPGFDDVSEAADVSRDQHASAEGVSGVAAIVPEDVKVADKSGFVLSAAYPWPTGRGLPGVRRRVDHPPR